MSADKHRGIRRQKQKRAKDLKRQARQQQSQPTEAQRRSAKGPATPKAG